MGFEVLVDDSNESVSKKIREAQINLYNYILTVGDKEVEAKNISVRTRDNVVHGEMDVEVFAATILKEREEKMLASPLTAPKTADVH
jgi:threonyl-tRNA synthetase